MIHVKASQYNTCSMLYAMTCYEAEVCFGLGHRPRLALVLVLALAFGLVQIQL